MREYGQVQCAFWAHPDTLALSDDGRLLALYLLTSPHSNGIGCYRLPFGYIQADFGWPSERVSKGFEELFETGFCKRCESTDFVFLPKYLKWNAIANPNVAKARISEISKIPKSFSFYSDLLDSLEAYGNHWPNGFVNGLRNGMANKNQTKPNQLDRNPGDCAPAISKPKSGHRKYPDDYPKPFVELREAYPIRGGGDPNPAALMAYNALMKSEAIEHLDLLAQVRKYRAYCEERAIVGTETVQQLASFLGPKKQGYAQDWKVNGSVAQVWAPFGQYAEETP